MSIYIRRVDEFDIREYRPSDVNFDVQSYIDWIMNHTGEGRGTYVSNAEQDSDGNLVLTYTDYGISDSYVMVQEGEFLLVQAVPDHGAAVFKMSVEDIANQFVPKP